LKLDLAFKQANQDVTLNLSGRSAGSNHSKTSKRSQSKDKHADHHPTKAKPHKEKRDKKKREGPSRKRTENYESSHQIAERLEQVERKLIVFEVFSD